MEFLLSLISDAMTYGPGLKVTKPFLLEGKRDDGYAGLSVGRIIDIMFS